MSLSPDDTPALLGLMAGAFVLAGLRVWRIFSLSPLVASDSPRFCLLGTFAGCGFALWLALIFFAAQDVRNSLGYQTLFVASGAIALEVVLRALAVLGLDADQDALERNNPAARIAIAGACVGLTLGAIGSNLGEGDEISTTLFPLTLCTLGLLAVAFVLALVTHGFTPVSVERDRSAGFRVGATLAAAGLLLAESAEGDWVSTDATVHDFVAAVPWLVALTLAASVVEARCTRLRQLGHGAGLLSVQTILPALGYFAVPAAAWWLTG